jgi:hypothetical protein
MLESNGSAAGIEGVMSHGGGRLQNVSLVTFQPLVVLVMMVPRSSVRHSL